MAGEVKKDGRRVVFFVLFKSLDKPPTTLSKQSKEQELDMAVPQEYDRAFRTERRHENKVFF